MRKTALLLLSFIAGLETSAQFYDGIAISNYSGCTGAVLNPSFIVNGKLERDLLLGAADLDMVNDAVLLDYGVFSNPVLENPESRSQGMSPNVRLASGDYRRYALVNMRASGPAYLYSGAKHSFCIFTSLRSNATISGITFPALQIVLAELKDSNVIFNNMQKIEKDLHVSALVWKELGVSYGRNIFKHYMSWLDAGITIKYLSAMAGGYVHVNGLTATPINDTTKFLQSDMTVNTGYASPAITILSSAGKGLAADAGITLYRTANHRFAVQCPNFIRINRMRVKRECTYRWKLGLSVTDLGFVSISDNTNTTDFKGAGFVSPNAQGTVTFQANVIPDRFSFGSGSFMLFLPVCGHMVFDYNLNNRIFGSVTFSQRLAPMTSRGPAAINQLTFIPRFESSDLEFGFPVSVVEYSQAQAGFYLRYKYVFAGTRTLASALGTNDFTSLSLYAGIRYYILKSKAGQPRMLR